MSHSNTESTNNDFVSILCDVATQWSEVAPITAEWSDLLQRSAVNDPSLTPMWLGAWWSAFGPLEERLLQLVTLRTHERLIGIIPLMRRHVRHWSGVMIRRLELLGSGERSADRLCSEYMGPIVERGFEEDAARAVAALLSASKLGRWDELEFRQMNGDNRMVQPLLRALRDAGYATELTIEGHAPYTSLPANWQPYADTTQSSGSQLIAQSQQALELWSGGDFEIECAESADSLAIGTAILKHLHATRWSPHDLNEPYSKGESPNDTLSRWFITSLSSPNPLDSRSDGTLASIRFRDFHDAMMRDLFECGALDLSWLRVRGEPISILYNIIWNDKAYCYRSGQRSDIPGGIRPDLVLHTHAIQRAIKRGLKEYDFLGVSERFEQQLAPNSRAIVRLHVSRDSSALQLRRAAEWCASEVTEAYRRLISKHRTHSR